MNVRSLIPYWGLLLAVGVTAALQAEIALRSPSVTADGIIFAEIAQCLDRAPIDTFRARDQHPGYPAMMLASTRIVQALGYRHEPECWMLGGQIVAFVCGLLTVCVVWLFARDLFDTKIANLAAFSLAVLPVPRSNAADAMSDTPHLLFFLLAAWMATLALAKNSLPRMLAAGLASGLAYWIRPEGLEVALVAIAITLVYGLVTGWGLRRTALSCSALAAGAILVALPYMALAGKLTSKQHAFANVASQPRASDKSHALNSPTPTVAADTPVSNEVQTHEDGNPPSAEAAATLVPPLSMSQKLIKAVAVFVASICQGFKWIFLPFYLLGNIELVRRKPNWGPMVLVAMLGALHIAVLLAVFVNSGYIAHRHVIPLVALAMPFAALGIVYVGERLARVHLLPSRHGALVTLGAATILVLPYTLTPFSREFVPVIDATKWVEAHAEPGEGIISNSPYVAFYSSIPTAFLSPETATLDEVLTTAKAPARFDFVVLHVNAHAYRPQWLSMIEASYRPVGEFPDPYSPAKRLRKVMIFEAKDRHAVGGAPTARAARW